MEKKVSFNMSKAASGLLEKAKNSAMNTFDQNNDGKLDREDVSAVSETIKSTARSVMDSVKTSASNSGRQLSERLEKAKRDSAFKSLHPIFEEDLESAEFYLSKLIRVAEMDKRHAESEICTNSIGHLSIEKELPVIHMYRNKIDAFGLKFYPDLDSEIYYADPSDRDHYIALDEYFNYMKIVRISELQEIAQSLGAKHFRVLYKEDRSESDHKKGSAKVKAAKFGTADIEHETSGQSRTSIEIAAEMECLGHEPVMPTLRYLQKEPSIQTLITLRMNKNPMMHQKITLKLSNSSGIKVKDAAKIDAALNAMKYSANATVISEAQKEDRRYFEYEIDF